MNITELLMKIDKKKFDEIPTIQYKSDALSEIAGEDVILTLKATDSAELIKLSKKASDNDEEKQLEAMKLICIKGIVDPDLKSVELKEAFGLDAKATPLDLISKIWGVRQLELIEIAKEIMKLNGLKTETDDIKK